MPQRREWEPMSRRETESYSQSKFIEYKENTEENDSLGKRLEFGEPVDTEAIQRIRTDGHTGDNNGVSGDKALHREKRFWLYDKFKNKKMFQKFIDDGLSSEAEKMWVKFIKKMHFDFVMTAGDSVEFPCKNEISQKIAAEYPKSVYHWSVNEYPIVMDASRMFLFKGTFSIRDVNFKDTGVYVCLMEYSKKNFKTVGIYSLTVKTESPTKSVRETEALELTCNSNALSQMYPEIRIKWFVNDTEYVPGVKTNTSEKVIVKNVRSNYTGNWTCAVTDPATERIWHTAWYNVAVTPPPPLYKRLYNLMLEYKLYTGLIVLGVVLFVGLVLGVCIYAAHKTKGRNNESFGRMKDKILSMKTNDMFGLNTMKFNLLSETSDEESEYSSGETPSSFCSDSSASKTSYSRLT
ncbi:uncharacterized protein [Haliotis asinina]|uniref:uncharacterized protein n=1 Tax=Haliotis asinina TaxID=109174 RepID=UPI00353198DB